MEFKLNKIDTELRNKINAAAKEGKVHTKDRKLNINKDKDGKNEKQKFHLPDKKESEKKFSVDAVKSENINVEAFVEENEKDEENITKGRFLDTKI